MSRIMIYIYCALASFSKINTVDQDNLWKNTSIQEEEVSERRIVCQNCGNISTSPKPNVVPHQTFSLNNWIFCFKFFLNGRPTFWLNDWDGKQRLAFHITTVNLHKLAVHQISLTSCNFYLKDWTVKNCIQLNRLMSVFYASFLLLMINCVIILSKWLRNHQPLASGSSVNITVLCFCYWACPLLFTLWVMISGFKRLKTKYSIFGTALQWFRCYLTDRAQIVLSCFKLVNRYKYTSSYAWVGWLFSFGFDDVTWKRSIGDR